jgi:hypothetical protein
VIEDLTARLEATERKRAEERAGRTAAERALGEAAEGLRASLGGG